MTDTIVSAVITLREEKGYPLTHAEMDVNWSNLKTTTDELIANLDKEISNRETAISTEIVARDAAILIETNSRIKAVTQEVIDRNAAILVESTARADADTVLTNSYTSLIDTERSERIASDTAEASARTIADSNEATIRTNAIAQEASDRIAGDNAEIAARTTAISQEVIDRNAAILVETNDRIAALSTEVSLRTTADNIVTESLNQEIANRTTAITEEIANRNSAIDSAITNESSARLNADNLEVTNRNLAISAAVLVESNTRSEAITTEATTRIAGDAATLVSAKTYADGLVVGLWDDRGNYDASVNTFPTTGGSGASGAILKGDIWTISVAGTLGGVAVATRQFIRATIDTPEQNLANWAIGMANTDIDNSITLGVTGRAPSQDAVSKAIASEAADRAAADIAVQTAAIAACAPLSHVGAGGDSHAIVTTAINGFMSSSDKVKIDAITGTNTGDQTISITGDVLASASNSVLSATLANSGVTAGGYGSSSVIPTFTVDAKGRLIGAASVVPSGTWAISISGNADTATLSATATIANSLNSTNSYTVASITSNSTIVATSPNSSSTGAVVLKDASGNPDLVYLQATNYARTVQYGYLKFNASGTITPSGTIAGNISGNAATATSATTATYLSATQQTNVITGKLSSLAMAQDSGAAVGSFVCRATGTGDSALAGMTFWNDAYAIKLGIRADGYFGLGGWSRAAWSLYSDPSGNLTAAGNVTAYSDPRLKENFKVIEKPFDILNKIDGGTFNWRSGFPHTECKAGKLDYGILADQVMEVMPEIVIDSIKIDGVSYKTVCYEKITPVILEATKDLDSRVIANDTTIAALLEVIEELKARITVLESK